MRYSSNGQHICMERGQHPSDGARRIEVCEAATGAVLATFSAGFNPRWLNDDDIIAESPDGTRTSEAVGWWSVLRVPANRGQLDANGAGAWAVSDLSNAYVYTASAGDVLILNAREPRLSDGHLAVRHPVTGALRVHNGADLGPCEDSRWSSETIVWWLQGRVWGRTTPDAPTVELTVPGRSCSHPCPYWDGTNLWVGLVLDEGELWLCEWSDLAAKNGRGWRVGVSSGAGFDWAICVENA